MHISVKQHKNNNFKLQHFYDIELGLYHIKSLKKYQNGTMWDFSPTEQNFQIILAFSISIFQ